MENIEIENVNSRRVFLKKAAYAAPALMVLGGLNAQANEAIASSTFTHVAYDNGNTLTTTVHGDSGTDVITSASSVQTDSDGNIVSTYIYDDTSLPLTVDDLKTAPANDTFTWAEPIFEGWFN